MRLLPLAARAGSALMVLGTGILLMGTAASTTMAAPPSSSAGYTLFGAATLVHPGHNSPTAVQLVSDNGAAPFSGIDYAVPSTLTFAQIQNLSTDYMFTAGSCGLGSPRFSINVGGANAFVYIGPPPNYTGCPQNVWLNSGNLATPGSFIDTGQLPGGTFYDTFAAADLKYGSLAVTGIQLVLDAGYAFAPTGQVVQIDNTMINNTTYSYESAESCKNGGWQKFTAAPGPFKNQGDCVSYFATHGKNPGNG